MHCARMAVEVHMRVALNMHPVAVGILILTPINKVTVL
jgi:hypothetical protein